MIEYKNEKLMPNYSIIDSGSIIYSSCHGNKILDSNNNPIKVDGKFTYTDKSLEEMQYHVNNMLQGILTSLDCGNYIGFVDTRSDLSFRRDLDSRYKSKRIGKEVPKLIKECKEYLIDYWGFYPTNSCLEADDLCKIHHTYYKEFSPILISVDKDLKMTEGLTFDPKDSTIRTNSEYDELEFFCKQMLCGDEDLPGIPKIGDKKSNDILRNPDIDGNLIQTVFNEFIKYHGIHKGVLEFNLHYQCLYIRKYIEECPCEVIIQEFVKTPGTY